MRIKHKRYEILFMILFVTFFLTEHMLKSWKLYFFIGNIEIIIFNFLCFHYKKNNSSFKVAIVWNIIIFAYLGLKTLLTSKRIHFIIFIVYFPSLLGLNMLILLGIDSLLRVKIKSK